MGKASLSMKSLMLLPSGADRCMMTLHFPFFLGTAPIPDVRRLVSGRYENGPRMRLAAISFASSVSMMSGCLHADARFRAVCGKRGPLYPVETPLSMPASSHEVQALSG